MSIDAYRLGIDFGTSCTVAVLGDPHGRAEPVLIDGSPLLASAVCAAATGPLLVGRDALQAALGTPQWFEPHPKRRIDDGVVLLGAEVPVVDLIAAVLARAGAEAAQVAGGRPESTVVTCPASWGTTRRGILFSAATAAGLPAVELVDEPTAAATYLLTVAGDRVPGDAPILVYDLGAGTFDASLVIRRGTGFEVLATRGLDDTGGLDIDAAIVAALGPAGDPGWHRLSNPSTPAERRAARQLWDGARLAKESLTRLPSTLVHVPLLDIEVPLGREELDRLARPILDRTVDATRDVLREQGVRPADLGGVLLVGGGSRLPLVATVLRQAFGTEPLMIEQPELIVAKGSVLATTGRSTAAGPPPPVPAAGPPPPAPVAERSPAAAAPVLGQPVAPAGRGGAGATGSGRTGSPATVVAVLAVVLIVAVAVAIRLSRDADPSGTGAAPASSAAARGPSATASPTPSPSPSVSPTGRTPEYSVAVDLTGRLDMTYEGSVRNGFCTPFDGDDGVRYDIDGSDPGLTAPPGISQVRIVGFVDPQGVGCNGRKRLWATSVTRI